MASKTCKTCEVEYPKTSEFFYYADKKRGVLRPSCKGCHKIRDKKNYQENKEKIRRQQREYSSTPEAKKKINERQNKRKKENPYLRRMSNAHNAIYIGMLNPESVTERNKYWNALPYSPWELRKHLEDQFEDWMNWGNRGKGSGKWGLDHIIPQSLLPFDDLDHPNFLKCWALENLRPLSVIKNIKKGNKVDEAISGW